MGTKMRWPTTLAVVAALALGSAVRAADPTPTTITVERLCAGCAKKIAAKLQELPGVAKVKADVEAKTVTVTPKTQTVLSPRALWEVVEKGGEKPTKLEGPGGTFTAKPQS